jgi:hypothetical protein
LSIRNQQPGSVGGSFNAAAAANAAQSASSATAAADIKARSQPGPAAADSELMGSSRRRFAAAAAIALLWIIAIVLLAVLTANPVTLNREQIARSPFVVTAKVIDLDKSRVTVDKEWRRGGLSGEIVVQNLRRAGNTA